MRERDIYTDLAAALNCPAAIEALGIGRTPGRFFKPRDGWGRDKAGKMVRIPNPIDLIWTTDCLEVKFVKARTTKGMVFKPAKEFGEKQLTEMEKHNALLAIAFVLEAAGKSDSKVAIYVMRYWKFQRTRGSNATHMRDVEKISQYTIKGAAYGKVPPGPTRRADKFENPLAKQQALC